MKIVFAVTNDLEFDQRMNRICTTLRAAGHEVLLVGRKKSSSLKLVEQKYKQVRLYCPIEKGKLFYVLYNFQLFIWLFFKRFDVYSAVDLDTFLPMLLLSKLKRKPLVYDAHEWFPYVPEVILRKNVQRFWMWTEQLALKQADVVYTVSQGIANEFEKIHPQKVSVIRNMPVAQNINLQIGLDSNIHLPSGKFILYQGALNVGRGLELLFRVLPQTEYQVVLAGEGDLSEDLRKLAKSLNIERQVHFLGFIKPSQLPSLTQQAFIGYNLSENMGLSYYHSLNNKFFDYVQAELPSIINAFPEYLSLCSDYPVGLITDFTEASLLQNLNSFFQNETTWNQAKEACIEAKLHWNWDIESQKLIDIYQKINP